MKIAIMQPYLFPYLGYFKLLNQVDRFILLDNVQYLRKGWVNRNYLFDGKSPFLFTLPLKKQKQSTLIKDMNLDSESKDFFVKKLIRQCINSYKLNSYDTTEFENDIKEIFSHTTLIEILRASIIWTAKKLDIKTEIKLSSDFMSDESSSNYSAEDRIITLCKMNSASQYYNLLGGSGLYCQDNFSLHGLELNFVDASLSEKYLINDHPLSILDSIFRFDAHDLKIELREMTVL